jgi:hypothetical protein
MFETHVIHVVVFAYICRQHSSSTLCHHQRNHRIDAYTDEPFKLLANGFVDLIEQYAIFLVHELRVSPFFALCVPT